MKMSICRRCINQHCPPFPWEKVDTARWRKGHVICWLNDRWAAAAEIPYSHRFMKVLHRTPPDKCPYYFEQIVMSQGKTVSLGLAKVAAIPMISP